MKHIGLSRTSIENNETLFLRENNYNINFHPIYEVQFGLEKQLKDQEKNLKKDADYIPVLIIDRFVFRYDSNCLDVINWALEMASDRFIRVFIDDIVTDDNLPDNPSIPAYFISEDRKRILTPKYAIYNNFPKVFEEYYHIDD